MMFGSSKFGFWAANDMFRAQSVVDYVNIFGLRILASTTFSHWWCNLKAFSTTFYTHQKSRKEYCIVFLKALGAQKLEEKVSWRFLCDQE